MKGRNSTNPLAYRFYNKDEVVAGKRLEDHLRFAVAYWHSFAWPGGDPFGGQTFERPWFAKPGAVDTMELAKLKADVAFEMFSLLGVPYFCFHDADVRPEGATFAESAARLDEIADYFEGKMKKTGVKLLWGTANLFSHRRFMCGRRHQSRPGRLRLCGGDGEALHRRHQAAEGRELCAVGRARRLRDAAQHRHWPRASTRPAASSAWSSTTSTSIGFKGTILIEPKPQEPTKHQYDYDVATVYGFLKRYGLEKEVKVNIEQGHAILAGHSFEHELALANALGIFGSIDMNRNDYQSGWDTDQFPNNVPEMALAYYQVLSGGGFKTGGTNFDAKLRRQSLDPQDLLIAHIGGMDCLRARPEGGGEDDRGQGAVRPARRTLCRLEIGRGQGDAVRQAHAGRDRRARGEEEDRAGAEIRQAGISGERGQQVCVTFAR